MVAQTDAKTDKAGRAMSPRRKRYWRALGIAAALGGVLGAWMQLDSPSASLVLLGDTPLSTGFAVGASIFWIVGMALSMFLYHRAIDDHEERAYLWAGLAGWYAVAFTAPAWWILHRAGLAPRPDVMILFLGALIVNCVVWAWLKFR